MRGGRAKSELLDERALGGWQMIKRFRAVLAKVRERVPRTARESHGLRLHQVEEYLSLFLLAMFNPVVGSMRALCQASRLERVQEQCQSAPLSLSRFSEAQQVFDPEVVRLALSDLITQSAGQLGARQGGWPPGVLQIVDSTVWKVVPRMQWAQWRFQNVEQRAVRLHLKLRVEDQAPVEAKVTTGRTCERAAWREMARPGEIYVGDRYYGGDLRVLTELAALGCDFLVRLRQDTVLHWEREEPLEEQDRAAGIVRAGLEEDRRAMARHHFGTAWPGNAYLGGDRVLGENERAGSRGGLPPSLEDRTVFPLAQMPGAVPALAGRKRARRDLPDLCHVDRGAVAGRDLRGAAQSADDGDAAIFGDGLCQRRGGVCGTAARGARSPPQARTGGAEGGGEKKRLKWNDRAVSSDATRGLRVPPNRVAKPD